MRLAMNLRVGDVINYPWLGSTRAGKIISISEVGCTNKLLLEMEDFVIAHWKRYMTVQTSDLISIHYIVTEHPPE